MRSVQRGLTTTFIFIIILFAAVTITIAYFTYANKQNSPEINTFEACAAHYPVMESYPEQCQTPDGKHFTRILAPQSSPQSSPQVSLRPQIKDETAGWRTYQDEINKFSLEYPPDLHESGNAAQIFLVKNTATPAEKLSYADQSVEIRVDNSVSRFNQYYDTSVSQKVEGYGDFKIKNSLIDNNQAVEYGYDEAAKQRDLQLNKETLESGKSVGSINYRKGLIINKQGAIIEISTNNYHGDFKQSFDKILTTIKFLE